MLTGIDRAPTEAERNEMQIIGQKTPLEIFSKMLAEAEMVYIKQHRPFDTQCARIDFQDEIEKVGKESERVYGYVREQDIRGIKFDFDKYGKEDRFENVNDDEEMDFSNVNGIRTQVKIGNTIKYLCKRGHGISVFYPNDVYEERFGVKKKKEDK